MKKAFRVEDLDCAYCAAKVEDGIRKIDGVKEVHLSFMTQRLTIEADDDVFDEVMREAVKVAKKVEPDCRIVL